MIGHCDADCFYVSAERARRPHLAELPVGVLGNHGAAIIARSYEMKACGVSTGMAIWDAVPICPAGVYVKRDFEWYEVLSRLMLDVAKQAERNGGWPTELLLKPKTEFDSVVIRLTLQALLMR